MTVRSMIRVGNRAVSNPSDDYEIDENLMRE